MAKKKAPIKKASTLKAPTPVNKAGTPPAGGPPQTQALPPTMNPVANFANFSDEGAAVNQAQGAYNMIPDDSNDNPLATADGTQQYVYTSSAPLIAAGNPKA